MGFIFGLRHWFMINHKTFAFLFPPTDWLNINSIEFIKLERVCAVFDIIAPTRWKFFSSSVGMNADAWQNKVATKCFKFIKFYGSLKTFKHIFLLLSLSLNMGHVKITLPINLQHEISSEILRWLRHRRRVWKAGTCKPCDDVLVGKLRFQHADPRLLGLHRSLFISSLVKGSRKENRFSSSLSFEATGLWVTLQQ